MQKTLFVLTLACFSLSVFAQATPKKSPELKCPIMTSAKVDKEKAEKQKLYVDYKSKRYYVCCSGCVARFKKEPAKYSKLTTGFPIPKKS